MNAQLKFFFQFFLVYMEAGRRCCQRHRYTVWGQGMLVEGPLTQPVAAHVTCVTYLGYLGLSFVTCEMGP